MIKSIKNLTISLDDTRDLVNTIKYINCLTSYLLSKGDYN